MKLLFLPIEMTKIKRILFCFDGLYTYGRIIQLKNVLIFEKIKPEVKR